MVTTARVPAPFVPLFDLASLREEDVVRVGPVIVSAAKVFLDPEQLAEVKRPIA